MIFENVKITTIVNPNYFTFIDLADLDGSAKKAWQCELNLNKYLKSQDSLKRAVPKTRQIYGFYHQPSKRWIRVFTTDIRSKDSICSLLLWCLDYGTLMFHESSYEKLPLVEIEDYHEVCHFIKWGCLMVDPVEYSFNVDTMMREPKVIESWTAASETSGLANSIFKNFIAKTSSIDLEIVNSENNIYFINSIRNENGQSLQDILITDACCAVSSNQMKSFDKYQDFKFSLNGLMISQEPLKKVLDFPVKITISSVSTNPFPNNALKEQSPCSSVISSAESVIQPAPESIAEISNFTNDATRNRQDDMPSANAITILANLGLSAGLTVNPIESNSDADNESTVTGSSSMKYPPMSKEPINPAMNKKSAPKPRLMFKLIERPSQVESISSEEHSIVQISKASAVQNQTSKTIQKPILPPPRIPPRRGLNCAATALENTKSAEEKKKPTPAAVVESEKTVQCDRKDNMTTKHVKESPKLAALNELQRRLRLRQLPAVKQMQPMVTMHNVAQVFIHAKNAGVVLKQPLNAFSEIDFADEIKTCLKKRKFDTLYRIQSFAWPHIHEGTSMTIVNGKNTGKTFAYLPAILSMLVGDERKGVGPMAVIIVNSSRDVDKLYDRCRVITETAKISIVNVSSLLNVAKKSDQIHRGCHLLITTPSCFAKLAAIKNKEHFRRGRIRHLIFDDLDSMAEHSLDDLKTVANKCTHGISNKNDNPQIIITSSCWNSRISNFTKLANSPVMLFGDFAEAALFAQCEFNVKFKTTLQQKVQGLAEFLVDGKWKLKKTLIVVNNNQELKCLKTNLVKIVMDDPVEIVIIEANNKDGIRNNSGDQMKVHLTTDESLKELDHNVLGNEFEILVHFSLPSTYQFFKKRFALMGETFHKNLTNKNLKPETLILLDCENTKELPKIFEFLNSRKIFRDLATIENVTKMVEKIKDFNEKSKVNKDDGKLVDICHHLMSFGRCLNAARCSWRHCLVNEDKATAIPTEGFIKFRISHVFSPTHYAVQILEYYSTDLKKIISNEAQIGKIKENIEKMQNLEREFNADIKRNDICAIISNSNYRLSRCKILKIAENQNSKRSTAVEIYLLDEGIRRLIDSTELYKLPEEFASFPPLVTQLRILNVVNSENEDYWDYEITGEVKRALTNEQNVGDFAKCEVKFAIQNTIFTDNLEIRQQNDYLNVEEIKFNLINHLIKKQLCKFDTSIESSMKKLLQVAEIPWTEKFEIENELAEQVEPKLQSLRINDEYRSKLRYFESPESFFVILDQSENKVFNSMMKRVEEFDTLIPITAIEVGLFCLYKNDFNNKCQRARICRHFGYDEVEIFLVDNGLYIEVLVEQIFRCPSELIELFPIQAIKCRLMGIAPKSGETWKAESSESEALREFLTDSSRNETFDMKVINMIGDCYGVLLYHPKMNQRIDELAVKQSIATPKRFDDSLNLVEGLLEELARQEQEGEEDGQSYLFDINLSSLLNQPDVTNDDEGATIQELDNEPQYEFDDDEVVEFCDDASFCSGSFFGDSHANAARNPKAQQGSFEDVDY